MDVWECLDELNVLIKRARAQITNSRFLFISDTPLFLYIIIRSSLEGCCSSVVEQERNGVYTATWKGKLFGPSPFGACPRGGARLETM